MEKKVITIDVGNIPIVEVEAYMERLIDRTKKVPYMSDIELEFKLVKRPTLSRWYRIKRWFKNFFAHGDFTGFGSI